LALILFGLQTFIGSKGLGVGLGNTFYYAGLEDSLPYSDLHCFPVRLISDCGVFALIPLGLFAWFVLRDWNKYRKGYYSQSTYHKVRVIFSGTAILLSPLAVTVPSDSQDVWLMWLFYVILAMTLDPKRMVNDKFTEELI
jgi:hypothetical protein